MSDIVGFSAIILDILLQLAVEHGMGGADSAAKAAWMVDAIDQWFEENG